MSLVNQNICLVLLELWSYSDIKEVEFLKITSQGVRLNSLLLWSCLVCYAVLLGIRKPFSFLSKFYCSCKFEQWPGKPEGLPEICEFLFFVSISGLFFWWGNSNKRLFQLFHSSSFLIFNVPWRLELAVWLFSSYGSMLAIIHTVIYVVSSFKPLQEIVFL